jgi:peptidoglycan/LPS O-acetylase OafA/YrhL
MAQQAPPERNRYVDFLRALSILAVVVGHWLVAAPYMKDGAVEGGHLLGILPWTQWLT